MFSLSSVVVCYLPIQNKSIEGQWRRDAVNCILGITEIQNAIIFVRSVGNRGKIRGNGKEIRIFLKYIKHVNTHVNTDVYGLSLIERNSKRCRLLLILLIWGKGKTNQSCVVLFDIPPTPPKKIKKKRRKNILHSIKNYDALRYIYT